MPRITTKSNIFINKERKYRMMVDMKQVIEKIPCEKGEFVMADFQDECFMLFSEEASQPCASIEVNILQKVYDMTDPQILEDVLLSFMDIVSKHTSIPKDRIFAYYQNSDMWTYNGVNIVGNLLKI